MLYFTSFTFLAIAGVVSAGPIVRSSHGEPSPASFELPGAALGTTLNLGALPSGCSGLADIITACQSAGDPRCGCTAELQAALVKCTQCMGADPSIPIPKLVSGFIMATFESVCHPDKAQKMMEAVTSGHQSGSSTSTTGSSSNSEGSLVVEDANNVAPVPVDRSGSSTTTTGSSSSGGSVVVEDVNNVAPVPVDQASASVALFAPIPTGSSLTPVGAIVDNGSSPSASVEAPAASSAPVAESSAAAAPVESAAVSVESAPAAVAASANGNANNAIVAAAAAGSVPPAVTTSGVTGADYQMSRQPEEGAAVALSTRNGLTGALVGVVGVAAMML